MIVEAEEKFKLLRQLIEIFHGVGSKKKILRLLESEEIREGEIMTKHQINFTPDGNKRMAIQVVPILSPVNAMEGFEVYGGQIVAAIIRIGTGLILHQR